MSNFVNLMDLVYPVGSIYQSTSSISPAEIFGGTWVQVTDKFLKASNNSLHEGGYDSSTFVICAREFYSTVHVNQGGSNQQSNYLVESATGGATLVNKVVSGDSYAKMYVNANVSNSFSSTQYSVAGRQSTITLDNNPVYITCYTWYRTA